MKKMLSMIMLAMVVALTACSDDDNDNRAIASESVKSYIATNYPNSTIRDIENERGGYLEVEIMHDSRIKDVYFDKSDKWVGTTWDVAIADIPAAVTDAIKTTYPDYRIDDADYIQTPTGDHYDIEIERGNIERILHIKADGTIIE